MFWGFQLILEYKPTLVLWLIVLPLIPFCNKSYILNNYLFVFSLFVIKKKKHGLCVEYFLKNCVCYINYVPGNNSNHLFICRARLFSCDIHNKTKKPPKKDHLSIKTKMCLSLGWPLFYNDKLSIYSLQMLVLVSRFSLVQCTLSLHKRKRSKCFFTYIHFSRAFSLSPLYIHVPVLLVNSKAENMPCDISVSI